MVSPREFMHEFRGRLRTAGIRFAITSGQACVHFGLQQTTKDSDWIVEPHDLASLHSLLAIIDSSGEARVSYRAICGASLTQEYLAGGWTSHLAVTDSDAKEHHLDFFGKAPRVRELERDPVEPEYASRFLVAQMKKTDREKDWPFVFALGRQAMELGDVRGVLHGQDAEWLKNAWNRVPASRREGLIRERPLLRMINTQPQRLRRAIVIEKQIWSSTNRQRYRLFQRAWKEFYRQWRSEDDFQWPPPLSFAEQHERLVDAVRRHALPSSPLDDTARRRVLEAVRSEVAEVLAATDRELEEVTPPLEVLLP